MAAEATKKGAPGFQGSDKSGVLVSFYGHSDPVLDTDKVEGRVDIVGPVKESQQDAISRLTWTKTLGAASGRWEMDVKTSNPDFYEKGILDDDWIDITFTQHAKQYNVCRGLIDTIRTRNAVANGATQHVYTLAGRDHGKIFENTNVFFNRYIGENVGGGATLRAWANANQAHIFGNVATTVDAFLFQFLKQLNASSNARWALPPGLPGLNADVPAGSPVYFKDVVQYNRTGFSDFPARAAYRPMFMDPDGFVGHSLWALAQEWSDPSFCELFCDVVKNDGSYMQPGAGEELRPEDSTIGVIIRDKPFPTVVFPEAINDGPWFTSIPVHTVQIQELDSGTDIGRGGDERFNAFFVRSSTTAEYSGQNVDITKPLWYPDDVVRRGIRRMDVTSNYVSSIADNPGMVTRQRALLRDWYGLNAYYQNGTLPLGHLRPDIRIGSRVRIPGQHPEDDLTLYVEGITHAWALGKGRTTLTVTRGWRGTDRSLMSAINDLGDRYILPGNIVINDAVTVLGNIA